jgi:hypothetical protein
MVEELPSARAQEGKNVLEVRRGASCSAECPRIERSAPCSKEKDAREASADLEPTRVKISVRDSVACHMEDGP